MYRPFMLPDAAASTPAVVARMPATRTQQKVVFIVLEPHAYLDTAVYSYMRKANAPANNM